MFEKNVVVMVNQNVSELGSPIGTESIADFVRVTVSAESQFALDEVVKILVDYRPEVKETYKPPFLAYHCCMYDD